MNWYSKEQLAEANRVTEQLMGSHFQRVRGGISLTDVEENVERFRRDYSLGVTWPAMIVDMEQIPIGLDGVSRLDCRDLIEMALRRSHGSTGVVARNIVFVEPSRAFGSFFEKVRHFIATRIAATRVAETYGDGTPYCDFRVNTMTRGLSVHYSGAYYVSWNYFNSPTSPAEGKLEAGVYVFAVEDEKGIRAAETAKVTLPGQSSINLFV